MISHGFLNATISYADVTSAAAAFATSRLTLGR